MRVAEGKRIKRACVGSERVWIPLPEWASKHVVKRIIEKLNMVVNEQWVYGYTHSYPVNNLSV